MKHFKNLSVLCLLLMGFVSSAMAGEAGVTFLFRNGTKASFAFSAKPCLAMTADGISVTAVGENTATFLFSDVQRYYFEDDILTSIQVVKDKVTSNPLFRYANGAVSVSGMKPGERVSVATVSGALVSTINADAQGAAQIDLNGAPKGMYIIGTASGVSYKIVKR